MDREAWWATVQGVAKSWTQLKQLSMHTCLAATMLDNEDQDIPSSHKVLLEQRSLAGANWLIEEFVKWSFAV